MLTERQIQLLNTIIREYIDSSEPVGSQVLVEKYNLGLSPATVRNEMARLLEEGFLEMLHTSSGRVPTSLAYKMFLQDLMQEEEMPVLQEVAMKQKLWPMRYDFEKLLRIAVLTLSENVKELTIATGNDGFVVNAGAHNVLDYKEFWDLDVAKAALSIMDHPELLEPLFRRASKGEDIRCLIGDELGADRLDKCSMIFAEYSAGKKNGYVAVLGPSRMQYEKIFPAIKYTKRLIEELGSSW